MGYSYGCYILCVYTFDFNVKASNYNIQPEPFLCCDPARNLISTPFIQAKILQIQEKKRKGKFLNASNEKELRLTVSTSNFVSLMVYEWLVGTAADRVKVWVPRSVMPKGIFRNRLFIPQAGSSKAKRGDGKDPSVATESGSGSRLVSPATMSDQVFVNFSLPNDFLFMESTSHPQIFFGGIKLSWHYEFQFFTFLGKGQEAPECLQWRDVKNS